MKKVFTMTSTQKGEKDLQLTFDDSQKHYVSKIDIFK